MIRSPSRFRRRYGPWAVIAGASEGLGEAFALELAERGLNLVLVARRPALLEGLSQKVAARHRVQTRLVPQDLGAPDAPARVLDACADLSVGTLVYNAAFSPIGAFCERPIEEHLAALSVNCATVVALTHALGSGMAARGRGGIVLMSSMTAFQGSSLVSSYAATKAFNLVLAEGLWNELRDQGVHVLASCAGATRTPNFLASSPRRSRTVEATVLAPRAVARQTLDALGHRPCFIPGRINRLASQLMRRMMSRRAAVVAMSRATEALYATDKAVE